ncbi:MAG: 50S ribosome-binding GTPase [Crenarchaeota archaeon]|nr:50S ribosome-binding GTPase [Thermoproteota archaeon]
MKAWLCMVKTDPHDHHLYRIRLGELRELSTAAGYTVAGSTIQVSPKENVAFMLGRGKLEEIRQQVAENSVESVIFYNVLTSKQKYNLEKILGLEVLDRYDLTLKIFEISSSDRLSKLQIRLARLLKEIPYQKLLASIRFKTGREHPGPRSLGEYAYHETVASLLKRRSMIQAEIEKRRLEKLSQLKRRREIGVPTVCITGYYNAGKTTLFNALTNLSKPVSPRPFTTLSSKYYLLPNSKLEVFLVDTIGFVLDLDPRLIASFSMTLDDIRLSDLVMLTVDVSDPSDLLLLRIKTCLDILRSLKVEDEKILVVFNKCDLAASNEEVRLKIDRAYPLIHNLPYCVVSARLRKGLDELMGLVACRLDNLARPVSQEGMFH